MTPAVGGGESPAHGYVVGQPGGNVALDLVVLDQHLGPVLDSGLAAADVRRARELLGRLDRAVLVALDRG